MERRFFVTIFAPNRSALEGLSRLDLDLFGASSGEGQEVNMGGLITESNIEEVRKAGFRVEVHEEYIEQARFADKKSSGIDTMDDKAWLDEFNRRKKRVS